MPQEYKEKIPNQLLDLFEKKQDKTYQVKLDKTKELTQYNYGKETRTLLAYINLIYWCDKQEKEALYNQYVANATKHAEEVKEKYNLKNLKSNQKNEETIITNLPVEKPKESWLQKIIRKIKNIFKR